MKLGIKRDSCGAGEEERTVIKNLHSDLKEAILLLLPQAIAQEPSPVKPYVTQRKPPTPLKMRRKDLFGGQNLPALARQGRSFYLMVWLVEHSRRVAVLTMNSFWGFQMPQLCFSVFNNLQKLFIALYTSSIISIIL